MVALPTPARDATSSIDIPAMPRSASSSSAAAMIARPAGSLRGRPRCGAGVSGATAPFPPAWPGPTAAWPAPTVSLTLAARPGLLAPATPPALLVLTGSPIPVLPGLITPSGQPEYQLVCYCSTQRTSETIRSVFLFRRTSCRRLACRTGQADHSRRDQRLCVLPPSERPTRAPPPPGAAANPLTLSRCARTGPRPLRSPHPPRPPRPRPRSPRPQPPHHPSQPTQPHQPQPQDPAPPPPRLTVAAARPSAWP